MRLSFEKVAKKKPASRIYGDRADFASGQEVQCNIFYRFVLEEKGPFGFLGRAPSAQLKKPSGKVKRSFLLFGRAF